MHLLPQTTHPDTTAVAGREKPRASILLKLKSETAAEHARIEQQLNLLRPGFALADYVALLGRLYGYYRPWEERAQPLICSALPHLAPGRSKTNLLSKDLQHFGVTETDLPSCATLPPLATLPQLLGSMYVLEGSTLGGQILSRHFAAKFNFDGNGLAFFRAYGEKTAFMWKEFCDTLAQSAPVCEDTAIVTSAKDTFETMLTWLGGNPSA